MTRRPRARAALLATLLAGSCAAGCVSHPSDCLVGTHADPLGSLTAGVLAIPLLPIGLLASVPCLAAGESQECAESVMDFVVAPAIGVATVLCWITSAPLALGDAWYDWVTREEPQKRTEPAPDPEPVPAPVPAPDPAPETDVTP